MEWPRGGIEPRPVSPLELGPLPLPVEQTVEGVLRLSEAADGEHGSGSFVGRCVSRPQARKCGRPRGARQGAGWLREVRPIRVLPRAGGPAGADPRSAAEQRGFASLL